MRVYRDQCRFPYFKASWGPVHRGVLFPGYCICPPGPHAGTVPEILKVTPAAIDLRTLPTIAT